MLVLLLWFATIIHKILFILLINSQSSPSSSPSSTKSVLWNLRCPNRVLSFSFFFFRFVCLFVLFWSCRWYQFLPNRNRNLAQDRSLKLILFFDSPSQSFSFTYSLPIKMDILPSGHFFNELQAIHDTGYFPANLSLEDKYEQVGRDLILSHNRKHWMVWGRKKIQIYSKVYSINRHTHQKNIDLNFFLIEIDWL